ncbi:MAG: hypothetical protein ACLPVY_25260 [Acidimicrobiia bacterium]
MSLLDDGEVIRFAFAIIDPGVLDGYLSTLVVRSIDAEKASVS